MFCFLVVTYGEPGMKGEAEKNGESRWKQYKATNECVGTNAWKDHSKSTKRQCPYTDRLCYCESYYENRGIW